MVQDHCPSSLFWHSFEQRNISTLGTQVLDSLLASLTKYTALLNPLSPKASVLFGLNDKARMATETIFELANRWVMPVLTVPLDWKKLWCSCYYSHVIGRISAFFRQQNWHHEIEEANIAVQMRRVIAVSVQAALQATVHHWRSCSLAGITTKQHASVAVCRTSPMCFL